MRRIAKVSVAGIAGALLALGGLRLLRPSGGAGDWQAALRDAPGELPAADLAQRHALLAPEGSSGCALCHLPRRAEPAGWGSPPSSQVCLSCHDGAFGAASGGGLRGRRSHPIGADYRAAWMLDHLAYRPPDGNPAIRLEGGKVGCVSCHQLHGPSPATSRLGVIESACEACHIR